MKHVCKNERPWTDLVDIDHEDLCLRCGPRTLKVIHLGYTKVLMVGCDHQGQLAHVFVQDSTNMNRAALNAFRLDTRPTALKPIF